MSSTKLIELREKLKAKQAALAKVFEQAGDGYDFDKVTVLEGCTTTVQKLEKVKAMNTEIEAAATEAEAQADLEGIKGRTDELGRELAGETKGRRTGGSDVHPDSSRQRPKSLGQLITEHQAFDTYRRTKNAQTGMLPPEAFGLENLKTLFQTSAGWAPEVTRIPGLVIDAVTRPIQILDIIPTGVTGQTSVAYMEETTRTHAAAEKAEGAAYAESTFVLAEATSPVRKITDSLPVTDEQMEDVPGVGSYVDQRLMFGLRQRCDLQVLVGDGIAPNLEGLNTKTGVQTQAKGADPTFDALHKALTKVRVTGRAEPSHFVLHPNDWEALRLTRTADGIYIMGNPSDTILPRVWGLPAAISDAQTENTGLVGDFRNFCQLYERKGAEIAVGFVGDQFKEGKKTIRADLRVAFAIYRAAAFCKITGI